MEPVDPAAAAARYFEDGFLVVPGLLARDEVAALRHEAAEICRGARGPVRGMTPAADEPDDDAVMRSYLCIHFPHKISAAMHAAMAHPRIVDVLTRLIGPDVKCMQTMLFIKHAGKPGQAWHQDEFFIPTRDRSLTAAWIALDDATLANGCLWAIPGSHRPGILWQRRAHGSDEFDTGDETFGYPYADEEAVPLECSAGSVVFFNGYLLHRSLRNRATAGFRRALVGHYMSAASLLPWDW
ncbi:MAG TPA: phytanoyl-CoA dioxygenase family protein, partial [Geminicoccaceae bacterium]|nr:phytanoyl-CoA dioxygenase family protein [Geminicoccaceae bacterium]